VKAALQFGPAEVCSLMLLGLLAGSTLARGSPIKGVAMTVLGLFLGSVGTDLETGSERYTFGMTELDDGIELIALALGLFGIAEFMNSVNQVAPINTKYTNVGLKDMRPSLAELKQAFFPMWRGTIVGSLCSLIPGTGPTIASFVAYATEKKISKHPDKFGTGLIEGVVCPEAATHSSVQGDFIPTMSLGIPGDAVMALLLGALMIQGIVPGPQLISQHPDIFWGLVASFWIGNIMLVLLNVPLIGIWVKMLAIPYRFLYPSALFFVCIGVYAANNDFFQVGEVVVIGLFGYILLRLGFHPAPILLGFVLGPRFDFARRYHGIHRAADQRGLHRALRPPHRIADLLPAARRQGGFGAGRRKRSRRARANRACGPARLRHTGGIAGVETHKSVRKSRSSRSPVRSDHHRYGS
jgi:TctA family transporter